MGTGNGLCGIELNLNKNNQSKIINKIHWCLYTHYYMLRKTSLSRRKQRPKKALYQWFDCAPSHSSKLKFIPRVVEFLFWKFNIKYIAGRFIRLNPY